jgi:hypothetical protein
MKGDILELALTENGERRGNCCDKSRKKSKIMSKITIKKKMKSTIKIKSRISCTRRRGCSI